jgi:succinate dehydrogenase/fumarate reductase flavoprotein subunit
MSEKRASGSPVSDSQDMKEDEMAEERETPKRISRKQFVKGAALGAGALAGVGALASCGPAATPAPTAAPGGTVAPAPTNPPAGECTPCAVYTAPATWDQETDVVVVGSGVGLAAAIEAATGGADVLVVERGDHAGGLWLAAGGSCTMGGNNVVQQRDGVQDDLEAWYEDEMFANNYRGQPEIMHTLVERGADTVKWMQDLGLVWDTIQNGVLRPPIKRGLRPAQSPNYVGGAGTPNSGICWIQVWQQRLQELNVPIMLGHRMTRIYRPDASGPVVGIEAQTEQGSVNIKARKAVILCAGTYTDNYRMAQAWDPRIAGTDCYGDGGTPTDGTLYVDSAGDGHMAAAEIGAGFSDMSFVSYLYIFYGARSYWGWGEEPIDWTTNENYASGKGLPRNADFFQRIILVKNDGARYINEADGAQPSIPGGGSVNEWPEWPYTATYLSLPQPRNVWAVADADTAAALEWPIDQLENPNPKVGNMFDPECLAIADTLDDLASKMDIPAAALKDTVDRYNGFVDAGVDEDFAKPTPLYKIATPPFYGAKASLIRHTQRNGLRVNTKSQVLQQSDQGTGYDGRSVDASISIDDEQVIPHLYAAGECGDALGWRRVHNSLGHYATAARIAGENAAKETSLE